MSIVKTLFLGRKEYGENWYEHERAVLRSLDEEKIWRDIGWWRKSGSKVEVETITQLLEPPQELFDYSQVLQFLQKPKPQLQPRKSRRLAGQLPEFGTLPEKGHKPAVPSELPFRRNSNTSQSSVSLACPKKKSTGGKGAKPRGVSKSTQNSPNRLTKAKKQSRDRELAVLI